jgi:hypothetical protein
VFVELENKETLEGEFIGAQWGRALASKALREQTCDHTVVEERL